MKSNRQFAASENRIDIPLDGPLCQGDSVYLAWPEPPEFDCITELRNRMNVRCCFVDDRLLDPEHNREWIQNIMKRPIESLLSIRRIDNHAFIGTAGWKDWDMVRRTADFGRLMIDVPKLRRFQWPDKYPGVAIDACRTLRDFAMNVMNLKEITTSFIASNLLSAKVNYEVGMKNPRRTSHRRPDGHVVSLIHMSLTRSHWLQISED